MGQASHGSQLKPRILHVNCSRLCVAAVCMLCAGAGATTQVAWRAMVVCLTARMSVVGP